MEAGCTHQLAEVSTTTPAFFRTIQANGDVGVNDELHNVMEAIVGAEYGMDVSASGGHRRAGARRICESQRLGAARLRRTSWNWTAAAVYRGTNEPVQAFVGEVGTPKPCRPPTGFSKDRDVFYDGDGPRRITSLTTTGGSGRQTTAHHNAERVVNVMRGADAAAVD